MPKYTKRLKRGRRTKRRSNRTRRSFKRRRSYSKNNKFSTRIARILNPPITFEGHKRNTVELLSTETIGYSLLFDPSAYVNDRTVNQHTSHGFFAGSTRIASAISLATGDTVVTTSYGNKYWVINPKLEVRLTNYTSGQLFFKVYYLRAIRATNTCISSINDDTLETSSIYPNTNVNTGGGSATFGVSYGSPDAIGRFEMAAIINKMTSLRECKSLCHAWTIVKTKRFSIQPNDNKSVSLKAKTFIYDPILYRDGSTNFEYKPGDMKILIRVDSTITGSTVEYTPRTAPISDFISYGPVKVPYESYATALIAKKTTTQMRRYQVSNFIASATSFVNTSPGIVGEPIQTGGAVQAMTDGPT